MENILNSMNNYRRENGFYTIDELNDIVCLNNIIIDFMSVLISKNVFVGENNIFYPGVIVSTDSKSKISIGNNNILMNNTHLEAANGGEILIGNNNIFNDGPICVKCNIQHGKIKFSDNGRYDGKINIFGNCDFGSGSQIIGTINVYNCVLNDGGDFSELDPDKRAGLIKGFGTARGLTVGQGMVINGFGEFEQENIEQQSKYHKK